jgi:hypothetical protein
MRIRLTIAGLLVLSGVAFSWIWWSKSEREKFDESANRGTAVLECPSLLDLGEQERGQVLVAHVPLANVGTADLDITDIRTNCSCTGLEIEEGGKFRRINRLTIQPGESKELTARWAVNGAIGDRVTTIVYFATNIPDQPEVQLQLIVPRISAGVEVFPKAVTFGRAPIGRTLREVVAVIDRSPTPRIPVKVTTSGQRIKATMVPTNARPWDGPGGGTLVGQVEVIADTSDPGEFGEQLTVWFGESRPITPTAFLVSGKVVRQVESIPSSILLPRMSDGGPQYNARCLLRSEGDSPFTVRVESCPPGWQATVHDPAKASGSKLIEVAYNKSLGGKITTDSSAIKLVATMDEKDVPLQIVVRVLDRE